MASRHGTDGPGLLPGWQTRRLHHHIEVCTAVLPDLLPHPRQTGRSPSTISRELRRNRDPGSGRYRPFTAHKLAVQRRARPRPGKIAADPVLREFVQERLEKRWSPEQVSQALRCEFPDDPARHVVHETIYQAVYRPELGGLPRELPAPALRTRRRRRRPRRRAGERRTNGIIAMTMLDQRPAGAARPR